MSALQERTARRIRVQLDGCWIWTGPLNSHGYGPHRRIYERLIGPVPEGFDLDHLCCTHACVNPEHLEPVTHRENTRRAALLNLPTCKNGHPWTPENTGSRPDSWRRCRTCNREAFRRFYERNSPRRKTA